MVQQFRGSLYKPRDKMAKERLVEFVKTSQPLGEHHLARVSLGGVAANLQPRTQAGGAKELSTQTSFHWSNTIQSLLAVDEVLTFQPPGTQQGGKVWRMDLKMCDVYYYEKMH